MHELQQLSAEIWDHNYRLGNENSVTDLWNRLAESCAEVEEERIKHKVKDKFYNILEDFKFVPGGRIMANLGSNRKSSTLFNCYVHGPKGIGYKNPDSIEGIYDMLKAQAQTLKSEGGYGHNFSYIRPKGSYIKGIDTRTPGVVKFMELWDKSSEIITMGSDIKFDKEKKTEKKKIRKGAMMGVLNIWHPEIENFIKIKQAPNRLTKFNLSVGIFGDFMNRVINDQLWELRFPDTTFEKYDTEWNGNIYEWEDRKYPIIIHKTIRARELWDLIMYSTFTRNEPGILFFDVANHLNPLQYTEFIQVTNPCGEIAMGEPGICDLGSLNLTQFIKDDKFQFEDFKETIRWSTRFLDNINDISTVPLKEYKISIIEKRRIGLGTMGLGSLHFMLGIRYGSPESLELIDKIYRIKAEIEILESARLGQEKGSFKQFDKKEYFSTYWWKTLPISDSIKHQVEEIGEMRNSHRSMNAPTGNTATFANLISGGIEPVFMKEYIRWMIVPESDQDMLKVKGLIFPDICRGEWYETIDFKFDVRGDEQILKSSFEGVDYEIDKNRGLIKSALVEDYGWKYVKDNIPYNEMKSLHESGVYATTEELTVEEHLNVLQTISKYIDQNSSKTVNLSNDYSYEDFKELYLKAWHLNIKGLTTYRAGTMAAVLEKKKEIQKYQNELDELFSKSNGDILADVIKLPREYHSKGYIIRDRNKKKWYLHLAFADSKYQKPFAVFVNTNNKETSEVADTFILTIEGLCREKGIRDEHIAIQREKYAGQTNVTKIARAIGLALRHNIAILDIVEVLDEFDLEFSSFIYHLKKFLSRFIKDGTQIKGEICPQCNEDSIVYQEGCKMCKQCMFSKC